MKFFLLHEEAAGSGVFTLTTEVLDTSPAEAASACATRQAAENRRFALLPYEALAVTPAPQPAATAPEADAPGDKAARRS